MTNIQNLTYISENNKFFTFGLATTTLKDSEKRVLTKENLENGIKILLKYPLVYLGHEDVPVADLVKKVTLSGKSYRTEVTNISDFLKEYP